MRRATVIRAVVAGVIVSCLVVAVRWLWTTPLSPIPSKAAIGKLNLEQPGATLQVSFVPPKRLSSITLYFPKPMQASGEFCAHPDFTLSVRVRLAEAGGTSIIDELITKDRMQWTSWHAGPSLLLMLHGWLGEHLNRDREYDLTVTVDSAVADIGQAEVFLHWMDGGYVWGRETQKLQLTRSLERTAAPLRSSRVAGFGGALCLSGATGVITAGRLSLSSVVDMADPLSRGKSFCFSMVSSK